MSLESGQKKWYQKPEWWVVLTAVFAIPINAAWNRFFGFNALSTFGNWLNRSSPFHYYTIISIILIPFVCIWIYFKLRKWIENTIQVPQTYSYYIEFRNKLYRTFVYHLDGIPETNSFKFKQVCKQCKKPFITNPNGGCKLCGTPVEVYYSPNLNSLSELSDSELKQYLLEELIEKAFPKHYEELILDGKMYPQD